MDNVQRFFMELGTGFALLGREYRLPIGETEQFLDFLFYHTKLQRDRFPRSKKLKRN